MAIMICVQQLSKQYRGFEALKDVSFRVEQGQTMGFLGANGAGKTTTLRILSGYLTPSSGEVVVAGFNLGTHPKQAKRCLGYLPEANPLYGEMTVEEYLRFKAQLKGVAYAHLASYVQEAVERCDLGQVRQRMIERLSKGFKQRVGLADALVHKPQVLILDEPTVGLDPIQMIQTRKLIKELSQSYTIVLSSHLLSEVEMLCDKVVILDRGRVVAEDLAHNLGQVMQKEQKVWLHVRANAKQVQACLAQHLSLAHVQDIQELAPEECALMIVGAQTHGDLAEDVFRLVAAQQWPVRALIPQKTSLEDVFVRLTGDEDVT